jgi:hypothetical protein
MSSIRQRCVQVLSGTRIKGRSAHVGLGLLLPLVVLLASSLQVTLAQSGPTQADPDQTESAPDAPARTVAEESSPALGWDKEKQGAFILSLLKDQSGDIWAGTEKTSPLLAKSTY